MQHKQNLQKSQLHSYGSMALLNGNSLGTPGHVILSDAQNQPAHFYNPQAQFHSYTKKVPVQQSANDIKEFYKIEKLADYNNANLKAQQQVAKPIILHVPQQQIIPDQNKKFVLDEKDEFRLILIERKYREWRQRQISYILLSEIDNTHQNDNEQNEGTSSKILPVSISDFLSQPQNNKEKDFIQYLGENMFIEEQSLTGQKFNAQNITEDQAHKIGLLRPGHWLPRKSKFEGNQEFSVSVEEMLQWKSRSYPNQKQHVNFMYDIMMEMRGKNKNEQIF